ncbi:uncharacterized protein B0H18DRAFT_959911 [Fomitopsis serialis]|uniref:uncharacterized protein n=1 Tax=Fomitopsis serialis TaxID=139415 RepID=UPI0020084C34|nr:uncharacterized protein B0H18DRAFT_959911 [Neoantrodia serialis]KAH9914325.1 hypothetical protein B0H18DRAFT_959911 [Neoantrodia serialis]
MSDDRQQPRELLRGTNGWYFLGMNKHADAAAAGVPEGDEPMDGGAGRSADTDNDDMEEREVEGAVQDARFQTIDQDSSVLATPLAASSPPRLAPLTPDQRVDKLRSLIEQVQQTLPEGAKDQILTRSIQSGTQVSPSAAVKTTSANNGDPVDQDGDDEEDDEVVRTKGVKRGPRDHNMFNRYFRDWLKAKNVPLKYERVKPISATLFTVQSWLNGHGPGPDTSHPLLDWDTPMSEAWNSETIVVLSNAFLGEIAVNMHLPLTVRDCPARPAVYVNLTKKLQKVQTDYNKHRLLTAEAYVEEKSKLKAETRRNVRRNGTYERRQRIVRLNFETDPDLWKEVAKVVDLLNVGAMSSDHTDDGSTPKRKTVTRARTPWRAAEVADLMQALESYPVGGSAAGNKPYLRTFDLLKAPISGRKVIPKLPINFYDRHWYAAQGQAVKHTLAVGRPVYIPGLPLHSEAS